MTFTGKIEAPILKRALESVSILVDEVVLEYGTDGLTMRAVDPANVCMSSIEIGAVMFERYVCDSSGRLGIDLEKTMQYIKHLQTEISLSVSENMLEIRDESRTYTMRLIDPANIDSPKAVPSLVFKNHIAVSGKSFLKFIKSVSAVDEYCIFSIRDDQFYISAKGDTDSATVTVSDMYGTHWDSSKSELSENATSMFSMDYLLKTGKALSKSDFVKIELGENYPIRLSADMSNRCAGGIAYIIAPRVEP